MDVVRILVLASLLVLAACDSRKEASGTGQFIKAEKKLCGSQHIQGEYLVHWVSGEVSVVHSDSEESFVEDFLEENKEQILKAEPHYQLFSVTPTEELSQRDWGGWTNWGVEAIEVEELWGRADVSEDVIVAVIDSGLDLGHPELQGAIATNEDDPINGIDDDGNGLIDDYQGFNFYNKSGEVTDYTGHGTHVSGIIAAQHDVGKILGVAPKVKILPLPFIGSNGGGGVGSAVQAIQYASQRGAKVINASWGGSNCSTILQDSIAGLAAQDILFVAAAGNSGNNLELSPEYPAAFDISNLITVGASTYDEKTASFSNYGTGVDLMAPGANISSTYPSQFDTDGIFDGTTILNGTSMATPFVAGAAALLWSIKPQASYLDIKMAILNGVRPGPYRVETRGQLNLKQALEHLEASVATP